MILIDGWDSSGNILFCPTMDSAAHSLPDMHPHFSERDGNATFTIAMDHLVLQAKRTKLYFDRWVVHPNRNKDFTKFCRNWKTLLKIIGNIRFTPKFGENEEIGGMVVPNDASITRETYAIEWEYLTEADFTMINQLFVTVIVKSKRDPTLKAAIWGETPPPGTITLVMKFPHHLPWDIPAAHAPSMTVPQIILFLAEKERADRDQEDDGDEGVQPEDAE